MVRGRTGSTLAAVAALAAALAGPGAAGAAFPDSPPNDPLFDASPLPGSTAEQWDLASPAGGHDRGISADRAWPLSTGAGVTIAEIDAGIDPDHPELAGRLLPGLDIYMRDRDPRSETRNSHGTNVASVLAAATDNGIGIAGIAPSARVLPLRTADNILHQGARVAEALVRAADAGADVTSMSLGLDTFPAAVRRATAYAERRGMVVAAAIGNEFHFHQHQPMILDEVIAVGGLNPDSADLASKHPSLALVATDFRQRARYSNHGPHVELVAPTQVPAADYGGAFTTTWSGTSATTPHVAGVAALVLGRARRLGVRLGPGHVRQILRASADDVVDPRQGLAPGWDRFTGWGRVNAYEAVRAVGAGRIPPDVDIDRPGWYLPVRGGTVTVAGRAAAHASSGGPTRWELEVGRGEDPREWRTVARGRAGARPRRLARLDAGALAPGGWTLRLRARDRAGNSGEDRAFFRVLAGDGRRAGWPLRIGSSGESSPVLADLSGDRALEIVLATSDGRVRVLSGRSGRPLPGWPRAMLASRAAGRAARSLGAPLRRGFVATPAIGDVAGSRAPEVVVAGLDGRVYAWSARGRRVPGFPVAIDSLDAPASGRQDASIYASPALADLSGDGRLDIVVGAADQRVYAWDGRGRRLRGWPVLARDGGEAGGDPARILSSPAVGDLDGDGSPDVVEGTGEAYGSTPDTTGRVYAFRADGTPLPGWPVRPPALAADSIPLVGEGVPTSPVLADVDGDGRDEVAVAAFTGRPELYAGDGTRLPGPRGSPSRFTVDGRGAGSPATAPAALALGANAAFGRARPGGPLLLAGGLVDARIAAAQLAPATTVAFEHLVGAWDARSGEWLPGFPVPIEGWTIVAGPALADVDGDGSAELLAGSSGNVLHAFRTERAAGEPAEPPGWPKDTGGWLLAAPAVGDVDGDGRRDVVAITRDGWLYAWGTPAGVGAPGDWPSLRRDLRNSGRLPAER